MKELNTKTYAKTKSCQAIDETDIHQLTLEDRYYYLLHLKFNPLKLKTPLTHAPLQTKAWQSPSTPSKSS